MSSSKRPLSPSSKGSETKRLSLGDGDFAINPSELLVNAEHLHIVDSALRAIKQCDVFVGITTEMPLPVGEAGTSPFSLAEFEESVKGPSRSYTCGCNVFWADLLFTTAPGGKCSLLMTGTICKLSLAG